MANGFNTGADIDRRDKSEFLKSSLNVGGLQ